MLMKVVCTHIHKQILRCAYLCLVMLIHAFVISKNNSNIAMNVYSYHVAQPFICNMWGNFGY